MSWKNVPIKDRIEHDIVLDECVTLGILETSIYSLEVSIDCITMRQGFFGDSN